MKARLRLLWVFFLMGMNGKISHAQNFPTLQFSHITTKEGLSSNYATAIAEDKQGFIWIGTANGLNRYDGYRFKHYYHSNTDSNSLISNAIQKIFCDNNGWLWISTDDGVSCFNPAGNRFTNYAVNLPAPYRLKNNSSVNVYEDEQHVIWICNQLDVIYRINKKMGADPVKINSSPFVFYQQQKFGYDNIFRDRSGREWAFNMNRIYEIDKATKQPVSTTDLSALLPRIILKITQDAEGRFVIATWNGGAYYFDPGNASLQLITAIPKRVYTDIAAWRYQQNNWLICVESNYGIYLYKGKNNQAKNYGYTPGDASTLQGNNFTQSFIDSKGNLWIAGNSGVNTVPASQNNFDIVPVTDPGSINYSLYKNGPVFSYFETDSTIWLSKRFVSTFEYNKNFELLHYYSSLSPVSTTETNNYAYAYYFLQKGPELYISTDSGFVVYNTKNKSSHTYFPDNAPGAISFRTIIPLDESQLLVRTFDYGLFIFNTLQKKFTRWYTSQQICADCDRLKMTYLFKSSNNRIYICTQGQQKNLLCYMPGTDSFSVVVPGNSSSFSLAGSNLFGIDEDKEGMLWLSGSAGLFIYNPASNNIVKQVPAAKEMGGLYRICFDDASNAWVNAVSGIWCYVKNTGKWMSFSGADGLPGSQFEAAIVKRPNGDILAGLEGAVALFHPGQMFAKNNEPPAIITEASINDSIVSFDLAKQTSKKLLLPPGQGSFSVDFAVLSYMNTAGSRYYYKLEPLMKEFQLNDNGHINFNGLAPGIYTLHVKGGNKAGIIFSNEDVLSVEVLPYWYQAGWFKLLCTLLIAGAIAFFVKWRIAAVKKQAGLKQQIAETQMQALRAQMNPHFIFNSLNSIENFMMKNEKRLASDYLNKFSRLIRSILDSSRNELVPIAKDVEALQLYVDLQQLRLNHKFSYHTYVDPVLLQGDFKVPSLLIQPFVENAIEHGLSHSDKNDLSLTVKAVLEKDHIIYTIEDNGIGRMQSAAYNQQNKPYHKSVGLSITTDRLKLLNAAAYNDNNVQITDLYTTQHEPAGTRVTLKIKPQ